MIRLLALLLASAAGAIAIDVAAPAQAEPSTPFTNCPTAKKNGYCDIPSSSPMYASSQDRDGDAIACEC